MLSTANFILDVERAAMDADTIASESVLKELNAIITGAETATEAAADAASAADRAEDAAESVSSASTQIATNTADIADLKADFEQFVPGLSDEAKTALLACFRHVAIWDDAHGQDYVDDLEAALYAEHYPQITASFTPPIRPVYVTDSLDSLKESLIVKYYANEQDAGQTISANNYTLSGVLHEGDNVIRVVYNDLATTFTVTAESWDINWNYLDGDPVNNGFVTSGHAGTLTANGYLMEFDTSASSLRHDPDINYGHGVIEVVLSTPVPDGDYQNITFWLPKMRLRIHNGKLWFNATANNTASDETEIATILADTDYAIYVEWDVSGHVKILLNGSLIYSYEEVLQASTTRWMLGASEGNASVLVKAVRSKEVA